MTKSKLIIFSIFLCNLCSAQEIHERSLIVSNNTYVIKYYIKNSSFFTVPATNPPGQPHYACMAVISCGTNEIAKIETDWTQDGCWEDNPMMLVGRALQWTRYPNDSAGKGRHWVCKGPAMWTDSDDK
jgi:hypothetical protein